MSVEVVLENVGLLVICNAVMKKVGMVPHINHPSTWEAEAGK